jgi:hypothetical protein
MDWNALIGLNPPLRSRYCLQSPKGFIGKYTLVSDPTPLFTQNPFNALQFVSYDRAVEAVRSVQHVHPELVVREIRFQKNGEFWQPIRG